MTERQVWVFLLVHCPADTRNPLDSARLWPRVLQVVKDGVSSPPGVVLRPGESIQRAAERTGAALGIALPPPPLRLLAVDQQPATDAGQPEELAIFVDGGCAKEDTFTAPACDRHGVVWTPVEDLGRVALVHALRTQLLAVEPAMLVEGMPIACEDLDG
ncbi:hypothetical protein H8N00_29905 [Streptomyces sp. AC563]|uniref:hypothetical protein n=1 Tax=Streptomyces buecherae TaxID=2763006 RepID=UPI00164D9F6D|nr:hypothetical protein [Streptomyces buecherae]MBC3993013.1 hypothetical protein [Streptomyces buecherae]